MSERIHQIAEEIRAVGIRADAPKTTDPGAAANELRFHVKQLASRVADALLALDKALGDLERKVPALVVDAQRRGKLK